MSGEALGRARARGRWLIMAGLVALAAVAMVLLLRRWILGEVVARAERHGIALGGCELDLGLSSLALDGCSFSARPDGRVFGAVLTNVAVSGTVERVEVDLGGLQPVHSRLRRARVVLEGEPRPSALFGPGSAPSASAFDLPLDVEQGELSWRPAAGAAAAVRLSEVSFDSGSKRLQARLELVRRAQGQLSLGPEGLEVTLGDPIRPEVRFIARVLPKAERAELSLDLRQVPLRSFEGPWLEMTDALRPVELEGRVFASIPLGLSTEPPSGDVHLTLHGLEFPVPRELDGLIHRSPPKLSGKLSMNRALDRWKVGELSFLTGDLAMRGDAQLELRGQGLAFASRMRGPLACRAIAESARAAHADSVLAELAARFARRALSGSVEVIAALDGHTSDLEHARVFTTVGVGCGIAPLPLDPSVPRDLIERLPADVLSVLPRLESHVRQPRPRLRKD